MIKELFEQDGRSIFSFEIGQQITRVQPSLIKSTSYNENLGVSVEVESNLDHSHLGTPFSFLGVRNNIIYLRGLSGLFKGDIVRLSIHSFGEGWEVFELPDNVTIDEIN